MVKTIKGIINGGKLIGVIGQSKVSLLDFKTKNKVGEYPLFEDTNTRVSLSSDDRWLIIGSWKLGVKVFDLKSDESFTLPDAKSMTCLDILSRRNEVCYSTNKEPGFDFISFNDKKITESSIRYERIIEIPNRVEYLAFEKEKVFILNGDLELLWSFDWDAFALISYGFDDSRAIITGPCGEIALMNLEEQSVRTINGSGYCFNFVAPQFMGDSIVVLATDYKGGDESALLRLKMNLEVEEVLGAYPPPVFDCIVIEGKLFDRSGRIIDMTSGEQVDQLDLDNIK